MSSRTNSLTDLKSVSSSVRLPNGSFSNVSKTGSFSVGNFKKLNDALYLHELNTI